MFHIITLSFVYISTYILCSKKAYINILKGLLSVSHYWVLVIQRKQLGLTKCKETKEKK